MCHWRMAILLIGNFTWGWGATALFVLLPDHAKSREITATQLGQLFIIIGALGVIGRVSTAIFCKLPSI